MTNTTKVHANAWLKRIPIGYLHKGDRFVLLYRGELATGVADMDGYYVSDRYGFRAGNDYWLEEDREYINVRWDGVSYYRFDEPGAPGVTEKDFDETTNSGVYSSDTRTVWVSREIFERYLQDTQENKRLQTERRKAKTARAEELALTRKKADLQAKIRELQKQVEAL